MRAALRQYADRGVFRGFSEKARPGGATEFRFTWLTREPLVLRYDPRGATLTFKGLYQVWRAARRCWLTCRRWSEAGTCDRFPPIVASTSGAWTWSVRTGAVGCQSCFP
ncbi:MAG TPA: hypothetical protein VMO26_23665 [Vicinamibacterales bacterium]|nr:hypothetical protein [Vicinamibacterales bacterium]